jgi:RNA polymerase sigma factor (sigma-70 family)
MSIVRFGSLRLPDRSDPQTLLVNRHSLAPDFSSLNTTVMIRTPLSSSNEELRVTLGSPFVPRTQSWRLSLAEVRQLSCAVRCERILESGSDDLTATLLAAGEQDPALSLALNPGRLAWAVAFNVDSPSDESDPRPSRGIRSYCDRWPPETPWPLIWEFLTKPSPSDPGDSRSTLLSQLACSVACEHRGDWQPPEARPVDVAAANGAFEMVYARNKARVVGDVYRSFGRRAGDPDWVADEAWARVFCDYWGPSARRRFLGLSRISTLVCQVARYVAIDILRDQARATDDTAAIDEAALKEFHAIHITADPGGRIELLELQAHLRACLARLPAKQRIVAEMVWLRKIRSKRAAEILGVSEPAVSQHLKKAREAVAQYMNVSGLLGRAKSPT